MDQTVLPANNIMPVASAHHSMHNTKVTYNKSQCFSHFSYLKETVTLASQHFNARKQPCINHELCHTNYWLV